MKNTAICPLRGPALPYCIFWNVYFIQIQDPSNPFTSRWTHCWDPSSSSYPRLGELKEDRSFQNATGIALQGLSDKRDVLATPGELLCWILVCYRSKAALRVICHLRSRAFRHVLHVIHLRLQKGRSWKRGGFGRSFLAPLWGLKRKKHGRKHI